MRALIDSGASEPVTLAQGAPTDFGPYRVRSARLHYESLNVTIRADVDALVTVRWGVGDGPLDSAVEQFQFSRNVGHILRLTVKGERFALAIETRAKSRAPLYLLVTAHETQAPSESIRLEADGGPLSVTPTGRLLVTQDILEPADSGVEIFARSVAKGTVPVAVSDGGALLTQPIAAVDPPGLAEVARATRAVAEKLDGLRRETLAASADLGEAVLGLLAEVQKSNKLLAALVARYLEDNGQETRT